MVPKVRNLNSDAEIVVVYSEGRYDKGKMLCFDFRPPLSASFLV